MKALTSHLASAFFLSATAALPGCAAGPQAKVGAEGTVGKSELTRASEVVIASPAGVRRPPFSFAPDDERLLDDAQRGAFFFLWNESSPLTGMVVDRSSEKFASIAGAGFQLAALPVGVERGWVTRQQAEQRALLILTSLEANPRNRKHGFFYHFLDEVSADPLPRDAVSTIDSAIFFAGALVAGVYFEGEVRERADRLFSQADWTAFIETAPRAHEPHMKGSLSLGRKPVDPDKPEGETRLLPYYWADCGDEHRLATFLAVAAPQETHRADSGLYYRLRRPLGDHPASGLHVYLPWSGALFTNIFAHCFIDYASMGPDDPAAFGVERRPRVDWWENSRRAVLLNQAKCTEARSSFPNLGANSWGLSACDGPGGYIVPGVYPRPVVPADYVVDLDYPRFAPKDDFGGGVVAPYGAGCAVMFAPEMAISALRHYRSLQRADGTPLVWREPAATVGAPGGYGFQDSFNAETGWVAPDCVAIDQGPLVLAIENARTGRVSHWFHSHPWVQRAADRLQLTPKKPK